MAVYTDIRTVLGGLQGEAPVYNSSLKELLILVADGFNIPANFANFYCDQLKPIFYEIANIFEAVIG